MKKFYTLLKVQILLFVFISPFIIFAQPFTIATRPYGDTVSGHYGYLTTHSAITFNIENTTDTAVILTQVEMIFNYGAFCTGTIPSLWYSASSLAGPSIIDSAGEWLLINAGKPITIIEYNYYPLFEDLVFTIPAHTQYRFAVESTKGFRDDPYGGGGPGFDYFTNQGVTLKVGSADAFASGTDSVGYAGQMPLLDSLGGSAYFAGRITLMPATTTPVTLLNFTAAYNNKNANLINWQTSQELNSKSFTVQRAYNLPNFSSIQTIAAAGNSSIIKNYTFTDNNIAYKPTYYRLLQTDKDGRFTYSKTVQVHPYKNTFTISKLYPSPAQGSVTIEYNSNTTATVSLLLTDMLGRLLQQLTLLPAMGFNKQLIDTRTLAKGNYVVTLLSGNEKVERKFVKE